MTYIRNEHGFTMMELLVVIGIIAIFIAIVLAGLGDARQRARMQNRVGAVTDMRLALEQFRSQCGSYPRDIFDAADATGCSTTVTWGDVVGNIPDATTIGYFPVRLTPGGNTCSGYHLWTVLDDLPATHSFFTEDDDVDSSSGGGAALGWYSCVSGTNGINGSDTQLVYDFWR